MRGGERVLEAICELVPHATLFTLLNVPGKVSPTIARHELRTSFIQRLPRAEQYYRYYLPLFPLAVERFDLDGFDLILSSSHCVAKSVIAPAGARHLCYCHTPMRYAWDQFDNYFGERRVGAMSHLAAAGLAAPGQVGCRHERPARPLCGEFSICCTADPPIL